MAIEPQILGIGPIARKDQPRGIDTSCLRFAAQVCDGGIRIAPDQQPQDGAGDCLENGGPCVEDLRVDLEGLVEVAEDYSVFR